MGDVIVYTVIKEERIGKETGCVVRGGDGEFEYMENDPGCEVEG